jgi:hypothetical protein
VVKQQPVNADVLYEMTGAVERPSTKNRATPSAGVRSRVPPAKARGQKTARCVVIDVTARSGGFRPSLSLIIAIITVFAASAEGRVRPVLHHRQHAHWTFGPMAIASAPAQIPVVKRHTKGQGAHLMEDKR